MMSNAALAIAIESLNGLSSGNQAKDNYALEAKQHTYFSILLWSTFGLSFVRFTGVRSASCSLDGPGGSVLMFAFF